MELFAVSGFIWEEEPNASSRFEIKYTKKIKTKDTMKVVKNLSFCFKLIDRLADKMNKLAIKKGRKIRL